MDIVKENDILNEKIFIKKLESGMKCYIIPKKGYIEKQAMICTKYGSIDNSFIINAKRFDMPKGIAHFLEHKMFEEEGGGNVFEKFMAQGADCNAFTNFTTTAYYFNCTEKFEENLELLLSFTQKPYFTDENVEKEKGIIDQEITMYDDDPGWVVYFNMLKGMYEVNPIREDIAGTNESIKEITKDMLNECYKAFYMPSNMALIVSGDVDMEQIYSIAAKIKKIDANESVAKIERIYGLEPKDVKQKYIERKMSVAEPLFNIGFKDNDFETDIVSRNVQTKVLLDILAGESSELYVRLYEEGLINNEFDMNYMNSPYFGLTILGGYSKDPKKVKDKIIEEINRFKKEGIDDEVFKRIKKKHIGRFIKGFNSIDAIAYGQVEYFTKGVDIIDVFEGYYNLKKDDIIKRLNEHFDEKYMVLSVAK